ncbi:MAG TPA: arginine--tRNA ligase [Niabella sp.]|nr:arginine--tRNA ligase [Niabella sp.]HOZ95769.1 arginine--tRNA ligase [Niabella sp.]HQW13623.1 arginine--tRNA ligase [Niabella sp.]HQX19017.1 arginine--tRNA ligase [Niabella sp.]HQX40849.1 arginine--tRNA ligase [Niabella sp.]
MSIVTELKPVVLKVLNGLYDQNFNEKQIAINTTNPEFEGDYTLVLFSFLKTLKKKPEDLGKEIGDRLVEENPALISSYNVIKGFLNLTIADRYWKNFLANAYSNGVEAKVSSDQKVMVEYASPNTNKPLHLGHLRNIFLGWSTAQILKNQGNDVFKSCIYNDRGIHICKSMVMWKDYANGATPETTSIKGDHLVGDYYVMFGDKHKEQVQTLVADGMSKEEADKNTPMMKEAQQMLLAWEQGDEATVSLWKKMNSWVYAGFNETYHRIRADFDKNYFESQTYLLGKEFVQDGLKSGVFFQKEDGSVWIDLTSEGLDEKIVQRKDGTSVYITQDMGLADEKYKDFPYDESIYVIADEQNYHMKVLKLILQKLGKPYADRIQHLSYGMVELPSGRMKTREGTVVDADDLMDELVNVAAAKTEELGKVSGFETSELNELYETIALGALKFFLLRVDPKKRMVFNPEESIDFHGFTGPFIQYTHARIKSVLRAETLQAQEKMDSDLLPLEKELLVTLEQFNSTVKQAATEFNPSLIAIYAFNVAKLFNSFYAAHSIRNAETEEKKQLRLIMSLITSSTIAKAMGLLGIKVPERM